MELRTSVLRTGFGLPKVRRDRSCLLLIWEVREGMSVQL